MSSDGLGGHVCIVSSAAGLISLPGRRGRWVLKSNSSPLKIYGFPKGKDHEKASRTGGEPRNFRGVYLSAVKYKIRYPQASLIYINEEESWIYTNLKKRDLEDFVCQSEEKGFREVSGKSSEQKTRVANAGCVKC